MAQRASGSLLDEIDTDIGYGYPPFASPEEFAQSHFRDSEALRKQFAKLYRERKRVRIDEWMWEATEHADEIRINGALETMEQRQSAIPDDLTDIASVSTRDYISDPGNIAREARIRRRDGRVLFVWRGVKRRKLGPDACEPGYSYSEAPSEELSLCNCLACKPMESRRV